MCVREEAGIRVCRVPVRAKEMARQRERARARARARERERESARASERAREQVRERYRAVPMTEGKRPRLPMLGSMCVCARVFGL